MAEITTKKILEIIYLAQDERLHARANDPNTNKEVLAVSKVLIAGMRNKEDAAVKEQEALLQARLSPEDEAKTRADARKEFKDEFKKRMEAGMNDQAMPNPGELIGGAAQGALGGLLGGGNVTDGLMSGLTGGLAKFVFAIPMVGEFMQTASTYLSRKFSDQPLEWAQAAEQVKNSKLIEKATQNMGQLADPLNKALATATQLDDAKLAEQAEALNKPIAVTAKPAPTKPKTTTLSIKGDRVFGSEKEKTHHNMDISFEGVEVNKDGKRVLKATRMTVIGKDEQGKNVLNISHDVNQEIALDAEGKLDAACPAIKAEANKAINSYIQDLTVKLSGMMTAGQAIGSGMLPGVTVPTITAAKVIPFQAPSKS